MVPSARVSLTTTGQSPCAPAAMLLLLLFAVTCCTEDSSVKVVDFSRTIDIARPEPEGPDIPTLRIAVGAMVSPRETFVHYRELIDFIGQRLGTRAQLVQRKTYVEVNELLGAGDIDFAFVCSGPYVLQKERYQLELVATPEVHGSHFYQSYLIVNAASPVHSLEELRGKTFAFTDPHSNTGRLVPRYWLEMQGEQPDIFFSKIIYTYSHDNSIMAVARGLVDAASVDGLIWEYYHRRTPAVTALTRVVKKSELYGIPPLVASAKVSSMTKEALQRLLFSMHTDAHGKAILDHLMIDRFVEPRDQWYDGIRIMLQALRVDEKGLP